MRSDKADTLMRDAISTLLTWKEQQDYCHGARKGMGCDGCKYNIMGFCDVISTKDCLDNVASSIKTVTKEYNIQLERKKRAT